MGGCFSKPKPGTYSLLASLRPSPSASEVGQTRRQPNANAAGRGGWLEPSLSGPRGAGGGNSSGAFLRKGRGGFLLLRGAGGAYPFRAEEGGSGETPATV